jgi:hypothetical protein
MWSNKDISPTVDERWAGKCNLSFNMHPIGVLS